MLLLLLLSLSLPLSLFLLLFTLLLTFHYHYHCHSHCCCSIAIISIIIIFIIIIIIIITIIIKLSDPTVISLFFIENVLTRHKFSLLPTFFILKTLILQNTIFDVLKLALQIRIDCTIVSENSYFCNEVVVVVWVIVRVCSVVLRRTVDDGFRSGCRNVSQHQQQSFSGLGYKPGRSLKPQHWRTWVQTFHCYMK